MAKKVNSKKQGLVFTTLMVAPPYAQLIIDGHKDIENRSRNCRVRGYVALYASQTKNPGNFEDAEERGFSYDPDKIDYGTILGFVKVVEVIEPRARKGYKGEWYIGGNYGYWLKDPIKLKKPVKGSFPYGTINWGKLKGKTLSACLAQCSPSQRKKLIPGEVV